MYEREIVRLAENKARYLIVGGIALGLHGYVRATVDFDIMVDLEREHLKKVIQSLESLDYNPRMPVSSDEILDEEKREAWRKEKNLKAITFNNSNDPIKAVDLLIYSPLPFEECYSRSLTVSIKGVDVHVASIDDLIRLKESSGRQIDLMDLEVLRQMRG